MRYRELGRTGLKISEISFGASSLGEEYGTIEVTEGKRAVQYAIDSGINYFDVIFAMPDYLDHMDLMRKERRSIEDRKINKSEFFIASRTFFYLHTFHTEYGKTTLQEGKEKNYTMIEQEIKKRKET